MRQLDKLKPWFSEKETRGDDEAIVLGQMTPSGFKIAEPLYWAIDHDSGELFSPVVMTVLFMGGTPETPGRNVIPILHVSIPGMCGHYNPCGNTVQVNMN
jgi:hypothetical protein